jgi:hypothetical protein
MLVIGSINGRSLIEILSVTINWLRNVPEPALQDHIANEFLSHIDSSLYGMGTTKRNYVVPSITLAPLAHPRQGKSTLVGFLARLMRSLFPGGKLGTNNPVPVRQRSLDLIAPTDPVERKRGPSMGEYLLMLNRVPHLSPGSLSPTMIFELMMEELGLTIDVASTGQTPCNVLSMSGYITILDSAPLGLHCDIVTEDLLVDPQGRVGPISNRIPPDGIDSFVLSWLLLVDQVFPLSPSSHRCSLPAGVSDKVAFFTGRKGDTRVPSVAGLPLLTKRWRGVDFGIRESLLFVNARRFLSSLSRSKSSGFMYSRQEVAEQLCEALVVALILNFEEIQSVYTEAMFNMKDALSNLGDFNTVAEILGLSRGAIIKKIMEADASQRLFLDPSIIDPLVRYGLISSDLVEKFKRYTRWG